MYDYEIPDPIERGEMRAERWYDDNVEGDSFKCGCGNRCKLNDGQPISPDPYAPPVCPECMDEYIQIMKNKKGKK